MAVCPFAKKLLIPPGSNDPRITPRVAILHVDAGNAASLYTYFRDRSGGIESHFHVRKDGVIEQYRDTNYQADANNLANDFAVSIETQGLGAGEWTPQQIDSIKRLLLWLHETHDIPLRKIQHWDGAGVGYHTLFGAPSQWTPVAKSCPGPDRIKQFDAVLVPWMRSITYPKPAARKPRPAPAPLPAPDCEERGILRVGTANLEHGRPSSVVARELAGLLPTVDVLICNEADDYTAILSSLDGFTWHAGKGRGQDKTGILARTELGGEFSLTRGSEQGWFTATGKRTPPKWLPMLDLGTVRVIGVHFPPSIERAGRHLPTLPVRRWAVYKEQMSALVDLIGRKGPVIVGGDWNVDATADKGGKWFPRYQMAHLGLRRDANVRGTHGSRVIDNLWARDVVLTETKLGPKTGSDHRAVVCTYEVRKS